MSHLVLFSGIWLKGSLLWSLLAVESLLLLKLLEIEIIFVKRVPRPVSARSALNTPTKLSVFRPQLSQILLSFRFQLILCFLEQEEELLHTDLENLLLNHRSVDWLIPAVVALHQILTGSPG